MKDLADALGIHWDTNRNRPKHCRQWRQLRGLVCGFLRELHGCWGGLLVKGPSGQPPILPSGEVRGEEIETEIYVVASLC